MIWAKLSVYRNLFNLQERNWWFVLNFILGVWAFFAICSLLEWEYAYSLKENYFFNENAKSVCEWILVTLSAILPPVFCQFFRGLVLDFTISNNKEKYREEYELTDLKT